MKNSRYQKLIAQARRRAAQPCRGIFVDGVLVRHLYEEKRTYSYWDDLMIRVGSQNVVVVWRHPRYVWQDEAEAPAYELVCAEFPTRQGGFKTKPIFSRVGTSRKKAKFFEHVSDTADEAFFSRWRELRAECLAQSTLALGVTWKLTQMKHGRCLEVVCPVELLTEADVVAFGHLVKRFLKEPGLFEQTYGDYRYALADFKKEQVIDQISDLSLAVR